ncbi:Activating signal cointegrator 1 [Anthophora retusa]
MDNLEFWISHKLDELLDKQIPSYVPRHLAEIKKEDRLMEYLEPILNFENEEHRQFIVELKKQKAIDQANKKAEVKAKESKKNKQVQETVKVEKVVKKKPKFVNLYSQEGKDKTILLKGRYKCDCEAERHALINNCLNCGRIVCSQEGSGPCFFCGELVCSNAEEATINSTKKQADHLYNKLMHQKPNKFLEESIKQRDKLIEYDRNGVQCTKIIDDECDYYQSSNLWLTAEQREKSKKLEEEMNQARHLSRLDRKIYANIDFAGRTITEDHTVDDFNELNEEQFQDILDSFGDVGNNNICPNIEFGRPMYMDLHESEPETLKGSVRSKARNIVQDKEYLEMSDHGLCLSIHQPYASLLVAGIKVHEGRTWYSSHRGRLWIAATSKAPTMEEISNIEHSYRVLKDEKIKFPESYPTRCLLGCVSVIDVLSQEEYKKSYPEGECDSPYVFICENFNALPIKFPIQGGHKIYQLDKKIHHAALKMIEKMLSNIFDDNSFTSSILKHARIFLNESND